MILLDTNVVSELRKRTEADQMLRAWGKAQASSTLSVSAITVLELEIGVRRLERRDQAQATVLRRWLEVQMLPAFEGRILPFDTEVARRCATLHVPDPKPERDAMIAATALVHGLTLATRNIADFEGMGVPLINPWETPTS